MEEEDSTNFDSLFIKAETNKMVQQQTVLISAEHQRQIVINNNTAVQRAIDKCPSRGGSRGGSGQGSRGSPARKATNNTLCPSNPVVLQLSGDQASRSHSMRDQTCHMKEKYQARYASRRMSTKTPQTITPKNGSRNNSIASDEVEVTRQFLATNKKVINRGDSFKKRDRPFVNKSSIQIKLNDGSNKHHQLKVNDKVYRVAFLGSGEVGKTSIIDQFMSSDHTDVYDEQTEGNVLETDTRLVTVNVNGTETQLSLIECSSVTDQRIVELAEDHNPDCYVVVYAVDDRESFDYGHKSLSWLRQNNYLGDKRVILVGNKADLVRSRCVDTSEGCDLAVQFNVKFTETSPGMGHQIDELLVGIVMQLRLHDGHEVQVRQEAASSLKQTVKGIFNMFTGKEDEKKKSCRNLNTL